MPQTIRTFPPGVANALGSYVYALRDPRDNKVFYIGKGNTTQRVFDHFDEAERAASGKLSWTAKRRRIVEIWESGNDVEWFVVAYEIQNCLTDRTPASPDDIAYDTEATLIDLLSISQNGPSLNEIGGKRKISKGMLTSDEVWSLAAPPVCPTKSYSKVFVFQIHKALAEGRDVYNATRSYWAVAQEYRDPPHGLAVGIANGLSKGVFEITKWTRTPTNHWEFNGTPIEPHELNNTNWLEVLAPAAGFLRHGGGYLVVEFDGKHRFRILRGYRDHDVWWPCC